ncbi:hypothetical protein E4T56_gene17399 [Termitomyces sp. T112]|nr:hypothetical protein E4T56_gene17399 [Termitomyces sp. T112]
MGSRRNRQGPGDAELVWLDSSGIPAFASFYRRRYNCWHIPEIVQPCPPHSAPVPVSTRAALIYPFDLIIDDIIDDF